MSSRYEYNFPVELDDEEEEEDEEEQREPDDRSIDWDTDEVGSDRVVPGAVEENLTPNVHRMVTC